MSRLNSLLILLGLDLSKTAQNAAALPWFISNYRSFKSLSKKPASKFKLGRLYPCLADKVVQVAGGHYFHQDLLVARKIFERKPRRHADIGSRIDGFVAHVAVFREIEVFDIRPSITISKNIVFTQLDLTKEIDKSALGKYELRFVSTCVGTFWSRAIW